MGETLGLLIQKVFSGGPESIIALLLLAVGFLGWYVFYLSNRERELTKDLINIQKHYTERLENLIMTSNNTQKHTTDAINNLRIVLAEIKAKQ